MLNIIAKAPWAPIACGVSGQLSLAAKMAPCPRGAVLDFNPTDRLFLLPGNDLRRLLAVGTVVALVGVNINV